MLILFSKNQNHKHKKAKCTDCINLRILDYRNKINNVETKAKVEMNIPKILDNTFEFDLSNDYLYFINDINGLNYFEAILKSSCIIGFIYLSYIYLYIF
jgi:hypothetical protein